MSKHTPGPWAAIPDSGEDSEGDWYVLAPDEDVISFGLSEPDAALIAAAPDLLGALQLIANFSNEDVSDMVRDIARAAIAKADGTS